MRQVLATMQTKILLQHKAETSLSFARPPINDRTDLSQNIRSWPSLIRPVRIALFNVLFLFLYCRFFSNGFSFFLPFFLADASLACATGRRLLRLEQEQREFVWNQNMALRRAVASFMEAKSAVETSLEEINPHDSQKNAQKKT